MRQIKLNPKSVIHRVWGLILWIYPASHAELMFGKRDQSQVVIVGRKSQAESGRFQPAPRFGGGQVGSCDLSGAFFLRSRVEPAKVHSESASDDEVTLAVGSVGEAKPRPEIPIIVFVGFIAIAQSAPGEVL